MRKVTGIVLTKNEEEMIADCLDSLSFCDEIIVIDHDSKDRTVDIAKHLGVTVYTVTKESFAERRNFAMKKAKGDFLLYIDADERITPELQEAIKKVLSHKQSKYASYRIMRKDFYLGNHEWPHVEKLERLFKKNELKEWYGELHESPRIDGETSELEGFLNHFTHRDLASMLNKTIEWSTIEAKLRFDNNHPPMTWWRFPRVMGVAFYESYIKQHGYKAGVVGVIESMYQAYSIFITYAKLWELQENAKSKIQ